MKIGILTYHRVPNYGALLQAVATRVVLQEMGHDVYYVDYYPEYHRKRYKYFSTYDFKKCGLIGKIRYVIESVKTFSYKRARKRNFELFIKREIEPYCRPMSESYDVIVYGSDQIWRKQAESGTFNPIYFGKMLPAKKHIAYAASMGDMILSSTEKELLKKLVLNLDGIGVREVGLQTLLEGIHINNVIQVLDPTLLITASKWDMIIPAMKFSKKYLLYYGLMNGSFDETLIYDFARKNNWEVIRLVGTATKKNTYHLRTSAGPDEFLNLIRNAEYVFTSSFHGLVFSILYHKQFFTSFKTNAQRAESILSSLGLSDRLLTPMCKSLPAVTDINYTDVNKKIVELREPSLKYLKKYCHE